MSDSGSEAAIRQMLEQQNCAVRDGDVDAMVANVAEQVVIFDVVNPLRQFGKVALQARATAWLATFAGPMGWQSQELEVIADGDVAFCHALNHVTGKLKAGDEVDMWFRTTRGFRRIGGDWMIVHSHDSAPFDPTSGLASVSLKP